MVGGAVTGRVERAQGTGASNVITAVQIAMAEAPSSPRRRVVSASTLPVALERLSWLFALYLCYGSLRMQEVLTVLAVPKLPMLISIVIAAVLAIATPSSTWVHLWRVSSVLRWQLLLAVLAVATVPAGIWIGQSIDRLWPGYFLSITIFCAALVVAQDRVVLFRLFRLLTLALMLLTALVLSGVGASTVGAEARLKVGDSLDPNDFSWILATFIPIAIMLGLRSRRMLPLWWGAACLFAAGIVSTQSRGGFLALIAGTAVIIFYGTAGWRRVLLGLVILGAAVAFVVYVNASGASRLTDFSGYSGGTGRTQLWTQGITWMIQRPWGFGMGNYETYNVWMTGSDLSAHSAYINIGVELGVLGLIGFLAIWIAGIRGLMRIRRTAAQNPSLSGSREEITLTGFLLASLVAHMTASAFLNTQYTGLSLFMQATAVAVVLGSPFRTTPPSPTAERGIEALQHRRPHSHRRARQSTD